LTPVRVPDYHPIGTGTTLAAFCADSGEILREKLPTDDARFPEGIRDMEVTEFYFQKLCSGSLTWDR
jgi:hypothetical protein